MMVGLKQAVGVSNRVKWLQQERSVKMAVWCENELLFGSTAKSSPNRGASQPIHASPIFHAHTQADLTNLLCIRQMTVESGTFTLPHAVPSQLWGFSPIHERIVDLPIVDQCVG